MIPITPDAIFAEIQASRAHEKAAIRADEREKIIQRIDAYMQLAQESGQHTLIPGLTTARIAVRDAPALKP